MRLGRKPPFSWFSDAAKTLLALQHYVQAYSVTQRTNLEKRDYLGWWQKATGCRLFVETGTYAGLTTAYMANLCDHCYTVELDPALHRQAQERLADRKNITLYLGDSAQWLPAILERISEPALFWLDAHSSGGATARGTEDTPFARELDMILAHPIKNHVLLIDDARCYCGVFSYPSIRRLQKLVEQKSSYAMHINNDIIVIHPWEY
ncbi:MAG: hypothetical protein WA891_00435 [Acidobacteriaceae bacterium]